MYSIIRCPVQQTPKEKEIKSPDSLTIKNSSVYDLTAQQTRLNYPDHQVSEFLRKNKKERN
jgi:hypothetical protein